MAKLNDIDKAAASKGKGLETLWQFIKFIVVSLGAFVIQTFLPYLIKAPMSDEFLHRAYSFWIFQSEAPDAETGIIAAGLGVFIAANASNVIAQIVSFFINRDKTFNSDANVAITLPIYIIFTIALICFSAWLSPTLITFFVSHGLEKASLALSGAICGAIQFFLYFPVDKILFHKKKEEKAE
jgi:putative flippase GtrA